MSLSAGTVSVTAAVATGSRLALALYNAKKAAFDAAVTVFTAGGGTAPSTAQKQAVFELFAVEANAMATAIVSEITSNAVASCTIPAASINATDPAAPVVVTGGVS